MSKPIPDLLNKAVGARNAAQRMMASFRFFVVPPTQDLEQTLSFEFFYQRRGAFGRSGCTENILKAKTDRQNSNGR
jgi:hypothetical protein